MRPCFRTFFEKWNESMRTGQAFRDGNFLCAPLTATFRPFLTRVRPLKDEKGSGAALVRDQYRYCFADAN